MEILVLDVNVEAGGSTGCIAIGERLMSLSPQVTVTHAHWRDTNHPLEAMGPTPDAVVLGPNSTPFPAYPEEFSEFLTWVREYPHALLGICGGHQVLALAHGATVGPVFDVPPATTSYEGMPKLKGPTRITVSATSHPLFQGLPPTLTLTASHVDEVQTLPPSFSTLAGSARCALQIISHNSRPQIGIQCHPERPLDTTDGGRLLRNWLALMGCTT